MMRLLKSATKKYFRLVFKNYRHLRVGVRVEKEWYGNDYGGFFVCPAVLNENSIVYSFGIGEDISFDEAVIFRHFCNVHAFDPTPKSIAWINSPCRNLPAGFQFHELGISDRNGKLDFYLPRNTQHVSGSLVLHRNVSSKEIVQVKVSRLTDIMRNLGHKKIDLLKIDIEGAEYAVIRDILASNISIHQLVVEYHDRFFPNGRTKTAESIDLLKSHGFEVFGVSDSLEEVSFLNRHFEFNL